MFCFSCSLLYEVRQTSLMFSNWYNWFAWFFGWIRLKVPMQQRTKLSLRSQCLRCMIRMKEMKMRNGIMGENAYWLCLDILDVGSMFFWLYINILKRIRVWRWLIDGNHRPILIYWDFGFGVCITFWHGLLEFWSKCSNALHCIPLVCSFAIQIWRNAIFYL